MTANDKRLKKLRQKMRGDYVAEQSKIAMMTTPRKD